MMRKGIFTALFAAAVYLPGCAAVVTNVAQKAYEDRSTAGQITDAKIHARILNLLSSTDPNLPIDVNTDVWRRRVLFTGALDDPGLRRGIEKAVRKDGRIHATHNHIQIVSKRVKERRRASRGGGEPPNAKVGRLISDAWIGAKIKVRLLAAAGVKSVNYRWQVVLNRVYVIGTAGSRAERGLVLRILRATKGVKSVVSHIDTDTR